MNSAVLFTGLSLVGLLQVGSCSKTPSPVFKAGDCVILNGTDENVLTEKIIAVKDKEYKTALVQYSKMCQKDETWCFSIKFTDQHLFEKTSCPE